MTNAQKKRKLSRQARVTCPYTAHKKANLSFCVCIGAFKSRILYSVAIPIDWTMQNKREKQQKSPQRKADGPVFMLYSDADICIEVTKSN